MKVKTICILLLAAIFASCSDSEKISGVRREYRESYIWAYFNPENIDVLERVYFSTDESSMKIISSPVDNIGAEVNAGKYYSVNDAIFFQVDLSSRIISPDTDLQRYEELRDQLHDTSFNKEITLGGGDIIALTENIDGIRVTVKETYSNDYPAGSDVTALFTVYYEHPYAVILNGYEAPIGTYRDEWTNPELPQAIYKGDLSKVNFSNKTALGNTFRLLLNQAPEQTGTYTFTIEVAKATGGILEAQTIPIPIKVE